MAGLFYIVLCHIPFPGVDVSALSRSQQLSGFSVTARFSVLALGVTPLLLAAGLVECFKLFFFRINAFRGAATPHNVTEMVVRIGALLLAAFQSYGLAIALSQANIVTLERPVVVWTTVASCLGSTALLIFISERIRWQGLVGGLWFLLLLPDLLDLPNNFSLISELLRTGRISEIHLMASIAFTIASVYAIIFCLKSWSSLLASRSLNAGVARGPDYAIMVWPPYLTQIVLSLMLPLFFHLLPAEEPLDSAHIKRVATVAWAVIMPIFTFLYIIKFSVSRRRIQKPTYTAFAMIAATQIAVILASNIFSEFLVLPLSGMAIIVAVTLFFSLDQLQTEQNMKVTAKIGRPQQK
ncbi:hypothetical protein [Oryzifoliimicrobium ureilyticus]|uniref:hypothetical protein n=1 Tax=Oryzifoliimicrobium ureilyticus TaxID=3113724 RepID=UPI003076649B